MAEATVTIVLETLRDLLVKEAKFLSGVSHEVEELSAELERMKCFLKEVDTKQYEDERIRNLVKQIKRLAYKAEDVIEEFSIQVSSKKGGGMKRVLKRFACILREGNALHKAGMEIANIKTSITNLTTSFSTYGIKSLIEGESSSIDEKQNWSRQTYPHEVEQYFVGMENDIKFLVSHLVVEKNQQGVISIWGMGGSGKTTLAKKIYSHQEIKQYFKAFAWVCITQKCQTKSIMQEMLEQLVPEKKDEIKQMENRELVQQLYKVQKEKKCLVVLDDIWKIDDWQNLSHCFPKGEDGCSKVLLTTRNKNVAEIGFEYQIRCLTEYEGWKLLKKRAFADGDREEALANGKLESLGRSMVRKCGYLPLAIDVLGGILGKKNSYYDWELVSENIDLYLKKGEGKGEQQVVEQVLLLSYNDLPYHLKSCFIYLGFLQEDESVDVNRLYHLWMGEGMVLSEHKKSQEILMDVAEQYLSELANRCMVLVEDNDEIFHGKQKFKSCRLHDLMRDFCQSKCKDEEFLKVVDCRYPIDINSFENASRVAIINEASYNEVEGKTILFEQICSQLRSLQIMNRIGVLPIQKIVNVERFKLLRTLVIERYGFSRNGLDGIEKLIHLRYLGLIRCLVDTLPSSFSNLSYLHILDMSKTIFYGLSTVDIFCKIKRLRHLYLPIYTRGLNQKLILKDICELEILIGDVKNYDVDFTDLVGSKNLRIIKVDVYDNGNLNSLLDYLNMSGNLNLRDVSINIWRCHFDSDVLIRKMLTCHNLHTLFFYKCKILKMSQLEAADFSQLSRNLMHIVFEYTRMMEDPIQILERLPNLKKLEFLETIFEMVEMSVSAGGFPQLVQFEFSIPTKRHLRIDDEAMPNLSVFKMGGRFGLTTVEAPMRIKSLLH